MEKRDIGNFICQLSCVHIAENGVASYHARSLQKNPAGIANSCLEVGIQGAMLPLQAPARMSLNPDLNMEHANNLYSVQFFL